VIRFEDVHKEFGRLVPGRRVAALNGVTLDVGPGDALALVGPNGAGKTTLLQLLLGFLRPTDGRVRIGEMAPRRYVERHGVGYLPERVALPGHWTVSRALHAAAALAEVDDASDVIAREMEGCGLVEMADRPFRALSTGYRQRLGLAQALLAPRKVLLLDEPAHGLDPEWSVRLHERVRGWREEDPERILMLVTHDMEEVDRLADEMVVLRDGRVIRRERLGAGDAERLVRIEVPPADSAALASALPDARRTGQGVFLVPATDGVALHQALAGYLAGGGQLHELRPVRRRAGDVFREALLEPAEAA
jgi:ABC-2 type transport system ATP-binding protein